MWQGMSVKKKSLAYIGSSTIPGFRCPLGGLGTYPSWIRRDYVYPFKKYIGEF